MNVCESLTVSALHFPNRTALVFQGNSYSFGELNRLSVAAARIIADCGVGPGDRVAIQVSNCPAFAVWYYAVLRSGAIAVSISTRLSEEESLFIIEDSGAKLIVRNSPSAAETSVDSTNGTSSKNDTIYVSSDGKDCDGRRIGANENRISKWHESDPHDPALILYTSGTTGFPKGATLSHLNVRSNVAAFNHLCSMRTGDRVLLAVPLFHCFGQNALLNSVLNVGGALILQEKFDLNETKKLLRQYSINQLYGVPLMFQLLLDSCRPSDLESVNYCFSAAAPLSPQTSAAWQEKFNQPIFEGYGLTETSPFASYNHRNQYRPGSIGTPIDTVEMKIVDPESGAMCKPGELGEIVIKGPNVMLGYWNRPEETKEAIREGWFHSGDIGKKDEHGFYYIVDRVKDMIAVGGLKVFPAEVERVLMQHDLVLDAAVVGIEESILGEQVITFVVLGSKPPEAVRQMEAFLKQKIADYKLPRKILIVDELPRNPSGKILKTRLRDLAREAVSRPVQETATTNVSDFDQPNQSSSRDESEAIPHQSQVQSSLATKLSKVHRSARIDFVHQYVEDLVTEVKGSEEPGGIDQTFMEMGLDSLMLVEMGAEIQVALQSQDPVPASLLFDYPTVPDLSRWILETIEQKTGSGPQQELASTGQDGIQQKLRPIDEFGSKQNSMERLSAEIEQLSEEEALEQLMRELE